MKITSRCVGCAQCVVFCPTGAITVFGKADITGDCTGCGVCLKFCPQQAIKLNNGT